METVKENTTENQVADLLAKFDIEYKEDDAKMSQSILDSGMSFNDIARGDKYIRKYRADADTYAYLIMPVVLAFNFDPLAFKNGKFVKRATTNLTYGVSPTKLIAIMAKYCELDKNYKEELYKILNVAPGFRDQFKIRAGVPQGDEIITEKPADMPQKVWDSKFIGVSKDTCKLFIPFMRPYSISRAVQKIRMGVDDSVRCASFAKMSKGMLDRVNTDPEILQILSCQDAITRTSINRRTDAYKKAHKGQDMTKDERKTLRSEVNKKRVLTNPRICNFAFSFAFPCDSTTTIDPKVIQQTQTSGLVLSQYLYYFELTSKQAEDIITNALKSPSIYADFIPICYHIPKIDEKDIKNKGQAIIAASMDSIATDTASLPHVQLQQLSEAFVEFMADKENLNPEELETYIREIHEEPIETVLQAFKSSLYEYEDIISDSKFPSKHEALIAQLAPELIPEKNSSEIIDVAHSEIKAESDTTVDNLDVDLAIDDDEEDLESSELEEDMAN